MSCRTRILVWQSFTPADQLHPVEAFKSCTSSLNYLLVSALISTRQQLQMQMCSSHLVSAAGINFQRPAVIRYWPGWYGIMVSWQWRQQRHTSWMHWLIWNSQCTLRKYLKNPIKNSRSGPALHQKARRSTSPRSGFRHNFSKNYPQYLKMV